MYIDELTIALYAWDIADEGVDHVLDTVQEKAGCNAAYMVALMHHEKRPLWDNYYPHNPVRKFYVPEDSRIVWKADPDCYRHSRIKPLPSERDFLKARDWLDVMSKAARERGMLPQVEISHTPLDKERAAGEFADCIQKDIYGHPFVQHLCWNNSDAVQYMCCLATDLVKNHDVEMLQTCTRPFNPGNLSLHPFLGVTLGGCFCHVCAAKAKAMDLDWGSITKTVRSYADVLTSTKQSNVEANEARLLLERGDTSPVKFLLEHPELYDWLKFRMDSFTDYLRQVNQAIKKVNPSVDFRWNSCWAGSEFFGIQLRDIKQHVDSVRLMEYTEQLGDPTLMPRKARWVSNARRELGEDMPLVSAVAIRAKATPQLIHEGIRLAVKNGADSLSLAFWDGCTMEQLSAVRSGMEAAEVKIRKRQQDAVRSHAFGA